MMATQRTSKQLAKPATLKSLREQLRRTELEIAVAQAHYTNRLLKNLNEAEYVVDNDLDDGKWSIVSSAGRMVDMKDLTGEGVVTELATVRKSSYRAWRLDPHARGILRNILKYVIGRDLALDFGDTKRGVWADEEHTKLKVTKNESDPLLVRLVWDDFAERSNWKLRLKELVRRTLRDGDMFLRRFRSRGRVAVRFIEPDHVRSPHITSGTVTVDDVRLNPGILDDGDIGDATEIKEGVERLVRDVETVVAYHVDPSGTGVSTKRIPASDVIHLKCGADMNDVRGAPFLEPILKKLTQYDTWEEYRIILNKVRTAIALVRKVEGGTSAQAASLIAGRQPAASSPTGREPQTTSGRREAAFRAGTVLTPSAGVSYDFISPRLDARDAGEDGRRILMTIAAGAGMPEMLVTSDFCHHIDTDVLTDRGWVKFDDLVFGDMLATVNPDTGFLEFQKPLQLHSFHYNGEMYVCRERRIRFCVTPNHELWAAGFESRRQSARHPERSKKPLLYEKVRVQDLSRQMYAIQMTVRRSDVSDQEEYVFPWGERVPMDTWLQFLGYVISEGHILKRYPKNGEYVGICVTQTEGMAADSIRKCFASLPWAFKERSVMFRTWARPQNEWTFRYTKEAARLAAYVRELTGDSEGAMSWQKRLPDFVWSLSHRQQKLLLDALIDGDGTRYETYFALYTSSSQLADDAQRLGILLSYNTSQDTTPERRGGVKSNHLMRVVVFSEGHPRLLERRRVCTEPYNGRVWCATVLNGLLVTRYEGRVLVSGNSNANYASTGVAAQLVQGEWADWQDFFEPPILKIFHWVVDEAVNGNDGGLGLPKDADRAVTVRWPAFVREDADKLTDRRATLWQAGLLSKRTWAAEEGYTYDDELEAMREMGETPPDLAGGEGEGQGKNDKGANAQQTSEALIALDALEGAVPQAGEAGPVLARYVDAARALLLCETKVTTTIQTLIFDASIFDISKAKQWAKSHGFTSGKVDTNENSIRLRQLDPERFKKKSFRTISLTKGVKAVVGRRA